MFSVWPPFEVHNETDSKTFISWIRLSNWEKGFYFTPHVSSIAQQVCHRALDLGIILDSSYTIEGAAWQEEKKTAQALIDKLEVDENGVHIAVMVFSTDVEIVVPFNGYKNAQELKQDIEGIDFMNGWSRTDLALEAAKHQLFSPNGGSRDGIPKALIVLSDGRTDGKF